MGTASGMNAPPRTAAHAAAPAALAAAFAAAFAALSSVPADDSFSKLEQGVAWAARDAEDAFFERPPRGQRAEGNAWDFYEAAADALLSPARPGLADPSPEDLEADSDMRTYADACSEALDLLRKGLGCPGSSARIGISAGFAADARLLFEAPNLAALVFYDARSREHSGDGPAAAEAFLDAAFFGQDLARNGSMVHSEAASGIETEALLRLAALADRADPGPELGRVAADLNLLDRSRHPLKFCASTELLMLTAEAVNLSAGRAPPSSAPRGAAGPSGLLLSLGRADAMFREFYAACDRESRAMLDVSLALDERLDGFRDPLLDGCGIGFSRPARAHLAAVALCRALSFALGLASARSSCAPDPKAPIDPFSGLAMRWVEMEGGLVVYSLGPDGEDGGGLAPSEWNLSEPDLVLRFARLPGKGRAGSGG